MQAVRQFEISNREKMPRMSDELIHRAPPVFTHAELVAELESGDSSRVADGLASAVRYDEDWRWVQEECLKFLHGSRVPVRWAAATCLGDLAFFFHRPIDHQRVLIALYEAAEDSAISDPALYSISLIKQRFPAS
jgi:uncharacterized membrane-anchored protein